jgi:8-oxo-dGTP pyrophosphatase MutT (NUDIX family)
MNYVQEIRALIGHRPLILVSAELLILDGENRLLLQRRADNGLWAIPGGMMEPGETFEETARRETLEEVGLVLGELEWFTVLSGPDFYYQYPNGDEVYNVTAVFIARQFTGALKMDAESLDIGFFPLDQLPAPIIRLNQLVIERFLVHNKNR